MEDDSVINWITWYNQQMQWLFNYVQVNHYYQMNVRKRKVAAVTALLLHMKRKRYTKKKHWVAPIFQERKVHGFFHAVLPKLILEDLRFHNYIRMSATQFENLTLLIGADIFKQHHIREPIDVAERLLMTLRYLASGDSISSICYQYLVGLTTAANIISETCQALWNNLSSIVLPADLSEDKWLTVANNFADKWNFPHCIGAIDGKHIIIQCPAKAGSSYYNYKGSHSVVLLAICDANYIFQFVDIGAYGRRSDGGIFKESVFGQKFENNEMKLPKPAPISKNGDNLPYCLVGDEAFPLKTYLLRPYPGKQNTEYEKRVFNYRLSRARRTIENSFGILANRWRIFRKPIILSVDNTMKIVQATVCLHNWLRMADLNEEENIQYVTPELIDRQNENGFVPGSWRADMETLSGMADITRSGNNSSTRQAAEVREKFLYYFNNDGAVDWQYAYM
ncbi:uncharacterized protein [Temnothorax longispinosus]|uniref:uncharacterized protein n=1 Tax=Temnothorax longispinosus TaxID=300112 RepID=UPI003A9930B1